MRVISKSDNGVYSSIHKIDVSTWEVVVKKGEVTHTAVETDFKTAMAKADAFSDLITGTKHATPLCVQVR